MISLCAALLNRVEMGLLFFVRWLFIVLIIASSCTIRESKDTTVGSKAAIDSGEFLAKTYCSSCHLFPEPGLLDKKTWVDHALPAMGYRFGIYKDRSRDSLIEKGIGGRAVQQANVFPSRQIISDQDWNKIIKFYSDNAPDKLSLSEDSVSLQNTARFKSVIADFKIPHPSISALTFDSNTRQLYVADCSHDDYSSVIILNSKFKPLTSLGLPYPVSNLSVRSDTLYILMMGHFVPSDEPVGQLVKAVKNEKGSYEGYQLVLKGLKRPVDVAYADLNGDGKEDIVVCEFGNHTGSVSLFIKEGKKYVRRSLNNMPGAVDVIIEDINHDSRNDIIVLMAQGDEGVDVYLNEGKGNFQKERVLRFPAVFGSSSIVTTDFNQDGFSDLIITNGDNADATRILKPYHGIRIYLNDQHNKFNESFFYPMPGAYRCIADDFDKDGDVDIAAVSFFPDFKQQTNKGFIYLENVSAEMQLNFSPSVTDNVGKGRWITLIQADMDMDGFGDIVLGSFTGMKIADDFNPFTDSTIPLMLLDNSN